MFKFQINLPFLLGKDKKLLNTNQIDYLLIERVSLAKCLPNCECFEIKQTITVNDLPIVMINSNIYHIKTTQNIISVRKMFTFFFVNINFNKFLRL